MRGWRSVGFRSVVRVSATKYPRHDAVIRRNVTDHTFPGASADGTATGQVLRSAARFNAPDGIALARNGDLYVVDAGNHTIRRIAQSGAVTTFAGSAGVVGSVDGTGSAAQFNNPRGIATDAVGNLYVADTGNHLIRRITPEKIVTTLAGTAGVAGRTDGAGTAAQFNHPSGVAVDAAGNVYVTDTDNYLIRRIASNGVVTTVAGSVRGTADGSASLATFHNPLAITIDRAGNLYITDLFMIPSPIILRDVATVRRISAAGMVATLAGGFVPESRTIVDGTGAAARFLGSAGIAIDATGSLVYVSDTANHAIRRVTQEGVTSTMSATAPDGTPTRFQYPRGIAIDAAGNLYLADTGNHVIRRITQGGTVTIIAGREGEQGSNDTGLQ